MGNNTNQNPSPSPTQKQSLKGNIALALAKSFMGFNQNALKYLVPKWMSPISGVAMRLSFGAIVFWIISLCSKKPVVKATLKQKVLLLIIGGIFMVGFMYGLIGGLSYTTPVVSSIFVSLQPATVFVICAIFLHERVTANKIFGLLLGLVGALIIILTSHHSVNATRPMLGIALCAFSTLMFSIFLVLTGQFLKKLDNVTVSKWTFTGGGISSIILVLFMGFEAPVLRHLVSVEMAVLLYILLFLPIVYFLQNVGLKYLKATVVALYGNLTLIVTTVASYILRQDTFDWWQLLAIVLMIASVYYVEVAEHKDKLKLTPQVNEKKS